MADGGFHLHTLGSLAQVRRWVAWRIEKRKEREIKAPRAPTGGMAKADTPSTWGARAAAEKEAERLKVPGQVGIVLGDHQGLALGGIDLDRCRAPDGALTPWASELIDRFLSYTEVSPSGTGVKIFFAMQAEAFRAVQAALGLNEKGEQRWGRKFAQAGEKDHPPAIELYVSHRYFTVTGQQCAMAPAELRFIDIDTLLWVLNEAGPALVGESATTEDASAEGLFRRARRQEQAGGQDKSRSAVAFGIACQVKRDNGTFEDMIAALAADPRTAEWLAEKGKANGQRELKRMWEKATAQAPAPWLAHCHYGNDGPRGNLHNALVALREDQRLAGVFRRDEMLRAVTVPEKDGGRVPATDVHVGRLQSFLQQAGLETLGKDTTHQAVEIIAAEQAFHPVRDYLAGLTWDGFPRLGTWLHRYLGVERNEYASGIGTMFMIAMVARVFRPGAKADYMLVLEGPQGARKSTACRILGGPWFSDSMPDIRTGKDVSQHLKGKWLIEVAEMSALDKAEAAALKAFVTRDTERYRPSYGRLEVIEPRQCVFIGSTNKAAYLRDETGGRRFWPVKVGTIDTDVLARDRDQLFAEAVHLFREGSAWWPDGAFEAKHIRPQQEQRFEADVWEQAIGEWLAQREEDAQVRRDLAPVTVLLVARQALGIETPKIGRADQNRITAAMERLGWVRGKQGNGIRPWEKGTSQ